MANWNLLLLVIISILVVKPSSSTNNIVVGDDTTIDAFIQCLGKQSHPSNYPISDVIYTPTNSSFQELLDNRIHNLRYQQSTTRKPLLILAPKSELNVPAVITCARANGLKIKIRSGGHDFEGISYTAPFPFILLDLFNLNSVEIDINVETAWVQSGATLGQIYYRIAEKSPVHAFPAGVCPTVGAGGHVSGGGYGALMRKYGLSVDNIVDARVVDANGKILDRDAMGEDFFWAIRGGGGSSFGVILAWKLRLVRVPPTVTVFNVEKDVDSPGVNHILYKWQNIAHKLPEDLLVRVESSPDPTTSGNFSIKASFISMFLGDRESLLQIMDKSFPELGITRQDCKEMSWIDSAMFWHRIPQGTPREILLNYDIKHPAYRKIKGDFIKKPIPEAALPKVWEKIRQTGFLYMEWTPFGGRMDEIDESAVPFAHRKGNSFMIFYDLLWVEDGMNEFYLNKAKELYDFMGQFASDSPREAVLNYVDLDIGSSWEKYFKGNFPKLVMVKTRVDPTNFFSHEQSIPTLYMLLDNRDFKRGYNGLLRLPM
ncbi:berberine bridge enzyme-like 14 [Chenopodium quinoa]|uniref:berberine bridge enzyme-like 14 n=1 Tax=Chenopodium quinoa TaxID=63459 RepID=UPI000B77667D|nr:berberine bridge enzyme-like 14 [Chenopodium quinoa]